MRELKSQGNRAQHVSSLREKSRFLLFFFYDFQVDFVSVNICSCSTPNLFLLLEPMFFSPLT
jgi:hypothetical protein